MTNFCYDRSPAPKLEPKGLHLRTEGLTFFDNENALTWIGRRRRALEEGAWFRPPEFHEQLACVRMLLLRSFELKDIPWVPIKTARKCLQIIQTYGKL